MATFTLDAVIGAFARVSQSPLEVLVSPTDEYARVSQSSLEVLVSPTDEYARISQSMVEVIVKLPIVGSKRVDATIKAHMAGSTTVSAVIRATRTFGTRDVTYAYSGAPVVIYADQTKKNPVEQIIPGCDLTIAVPVGAAVTIIWDVWQSHFQWGVDKKEVLRLHRDGLTGLTLWTVDPQGSGTDAGNNAQGNEWEFAGWYREAAHSGRYSLSFLPVKGDSTLYSSAIYFSLQTPGVGPGMTLDAAIVLHRAGSFTVAAWKRASGTVTSGTHIDATLRIPRSTSTTLDATLFLWGLGAFITRAVIGRTFPGSFTVGAAISVHRTGTFTLGALTRMPVAGSFTVGAAVRVSSSGAIAISALFSGHSTGSLTTNAIVTRSEGGSLTINAFLKLYSFRLDARIFVPSSGTFMIDATILGTKGSSFTVGAALARHDAGALTLDAVIKRTSFTVPAAFS